MQDPLSSYIEPTVKMGKDVTVMPFCVIMGDTTLSDGCVIESFSVIKDSFIGERTVVRSSRIYDSSVGADTTVGPNAHLREHSVVGNHCRIGNYVELKNSVLGDGSKASHLAYVGDAVVGRDCNVGCGVIFVNYDGVHKHHTTVGNNVFIGSNSNLIAPLSIGDNVFIACNTTVTKDLTQKDFAIGRSKVEVKPNRAVKYLKRIAPDESKPQVDPPEERH